MSACEQPNGCARYNDALYSTNPSGSAPRAYRHMNAHSGASPRRGPGVLASMGAGFRISGLRETMAHTASHARPIMPVNQKAPRHPHHRKMGVTTNGVITAPSDPPL